MMSYIDAFIDRITMYRLVLYYLVATLGAAFVLGLFHVSRVDPTALAFSTIVILGACWVANELFARVFRVVPNIESVYITGLILALIVDPVTASDMRGVGVLVFISTWAMGSKFLLAINRKHLFNPAAFAVALSALAIDAPATWWVAGDQALMPVVIVGGLLLTRKLRRFDLVLSFMAANLAVVVLTSAPADYLQSLQITLQHSPFFFFAFVMLTEPLTAPQSRVWRMVYGAMVGILSAPSFAIAGYYLTPELALLAGNLLTFAVGPRGRVPMTLDRIEKAASSAYDFVFRTDRQLAFAAGQYLEWTLDVARPDNRGNRRYLTIASAPTENEVRLGVKFNPAGSAFKRGLAAMKPGDTIVGAQLAGSFVLPANRDEKLVFIAGGIGITPFRSMLRYLIDKGERRDIVVLYGNARAEDIAYADVLEEARDELAIDTIYVVQDAATARPGMEVGLINAALIQREVPYFRERTFYISGPQPMVAAMRKTLRHMGVRPTRIKTDFFPGLA
ncbi:MAG TPA: RnfABCDGE type electron transport complex subunit D [Devosiaceae bacterium]